MHERKDFAGIEPSMLTLKVSALSFMPRSLEQNTSWGPINFKCHFKQSNCKKLNRQVCPLTTNEKFGGKFLKFENDCSSSSD